MKPTIGRIVHFTVDVSPVGEALDQRTFAAIITSVLPGDNEEGEVLLTVMPPGEDPYPVRRWVEFAEEPALGHWSWPPKV